MADSIRVDRNVPMRTRDGTVLRSDVYRPDDHEKHPAILTRTPYNKLVAPERSLLSLMDAVTAGYALVFQDVRGRFASEGEYDADDVLCAIEGPDGYDAVEWVAGEPWCSGCVGMAGASYNARLQWLAAMENPPSLKAIAPWSIGTSTISETTLFDGVVGLAVFSSLAITLGLDMANKLERQGRDVSPMRQLLGRAALHPEEVYNFLPLKDVPHFDFEGVREIWESRVLNAIPDRAVAERSTWDYRRVTVPCAYATGWYDFARGPFINFQRMMAEGGSPRARAGQHLLAGPWTHQTRASCIGDINFGPSADPRGARLSEYNLAFFDRYLRDMDVQVPRVRYFVMGRQVWKEAETWPLPQTEWQRFFLHSAGSANTAQGDGVLSREAPRSEPPDVFVYNPLLPVPTAGGSRAAAVGLVPGPIEQSRVEQRRDVLCYTSPPLEQDLEIAGPLTLDLFAATSACDTDFTAKLCDVYPDGRSLNAADGIVRARYRKSVFEPQLIAPGEIAQYSLSLGNVCQCFRKGHRIRLDIASSDFPAVDRNMNTGNPTGLDAQGITAMQTIHHEPGFASSLVLPVVES